MPKIGIFGRRYISETIVLRAYVEFRGCDTTNSPHQVINDAGHATAPRTHLSAMPGPVATMQAWEISDRYRIRDPIGSMGLVYLPIWIVDFYSKYN